MNEEDEEVEEHQATVDNRGLKMRIKRKQTTGGGGGAAKITHPRTKHAANDDPSSSAKTHHPQRNPATAVDPDYSRQDEEEDADGSGSAGGGGGGGGEGGCPQQKTLKRRRRNGGNEDKSGKQRDSETDEKTGGDGEEEEEEGGQNTGRDLCHVNSAGRKVGFMGGGVRRRRAMVGFQEERKEENIEDHPTGRPEVETMESELNNSETSDDPNRESSERDLGIIGYPDVQLEDLPTTNTEDDQTPTKKFKGSQMDSSEMLMSSSCTLSSKTKCSVGSVTCSVGVMTDPDCLGPCQPGTSVILEGIVWSESNNGILVVNVTWRGKTYVGTLMDATKHHWASPRFREESPTADLEYKAPKSKRGTPITTDVTTADRTDRRRPRKSRRTASTAAATGTPPPPPPRKSPPIAPVVESNGRCTKSRWTADSEADATTVPTAAAAAAASRRARVERDEDAEPAYKCMATECSKKFRHISGLRYHQSQAHRKQSTVLGRRTDCPPPEKGRTERQEEEEEAEEAEEEEPVEKLPGAGAVFSALGYELETDVIADGNSKILVKGTIADETTGVGGETDPDGTTGVGGETDPDGKVEETVGLIGDDSNSSSSGDRVTTAAPEETAESNETVEPVNESTQQPSTGSSVEVLRENGMRSSECGPVCPRAMTLDFENSAKPVRTGSLSAAMAFDARKAPNSAIAELNFNRPDRDLIRYPSTAADLFHKPLLRTPDVGKHRAMPQPFEKHFPGIRSDGGQPASSSSSSSSSSVSCPPNVGVRLVPCIAAGVEDRSPVYSDISDGSSNENELRLRRGEKDSRRIPRSEKPFFVPRGDDFSGACLRSNKLNARSSPLPSSMVVAASVQNSSCLPANRKSVEPVRPPRGSEDKEQVRKVPGLPPPAKTPVSQAKPSALPVDRCRSDKGSSGAVDLCGAAAAATAAAAAAALKAQHDNGLLCWMEMLQRANMIPFSYGVDPVAHLQLMTANAEYRNHYERWYLGQQQCYRQLIQAEKEDRCEKPVDMSAKANAASSAAGNSVAESRATTVFKLHGKPSVGDQPLSEPSSDKHRNCVVGMMSSSGYPSNRSVTHIHHDHHHDEKNVLPRSKSLVVPKQESVLLRGATTTDGDEKPLDLINPQSGVNKAKSRPLEMPNFSSSGRSSNHAAVKCNKGSGGAGGQSQQQDFSKASLPVTRARYEGSSFPLHFPGFQGSSTHPDSSLATSGNRFPVVSGKYPPTTTTTTTTGNETAIAAAAAAAGCSTTTTTKKTDPSTPLHSSKDLLGSAEKNAVDGFEFADSLSASAQDKPPPSSSSAAAAAPGHNSPLTLRHLHTHHHTHVVGAAPYSIYGSYSGLMSSVPTIVPSVVPVIPPNYIPK